LWIFERAEAKNLNSLTDLKQANAFRKRKRVGSSSELVKSIGLRVFLLLLPI